MAVFQAVILGYESNAKVMQGFAHNCAVYLMPVAKNGLTACRKKYILFATSKTGGYNAKHFN